MPCLICVLRYISCFQHIYFKLAPAFGFGHMFFLLESGPWVFKSNHSHIIWGFQNLESLIKTYLKNWNMNRSKRHQAIVLFCLFLVHTWLEYSCECLKRVSVAMLLPRQACVTLYRPSLVRCLSGS